MSAKVLILLSLVLAASPADAGESCMRATRALAIGAVPAAGNFTAADCGGAPIPAVRYDAAMRAVRLVHALRPGDVIRAMPAAMMTGISPGDTLTVAVKVGPVVVQRQVEALQPANPGQRLFVRAADGKVISVLYAEDGQ